MSETEFTPEYTEGAQDFRAGLAASENLYPDNPVSAARWLKGYRQAEAEAHADLYAFEDCF